LRWWLAMPSHRLHRAVFRIYILPGLRRLPLHRVTGPESHPP
jgi:hypothetical protein